jgi:hypothetical protein
MDNVNEWLQQTEARAALVSEAYRLELSRLWWANLMFVVVPAVLATAAAIVAALPESKTEDFAIFALKIPPAAAFAGVAAILVTIHKALKCDEYQAECLRLAQLHQSIAIAAGAALSRPEGERASRQERIARRFEELTESAKARLSTAIIRKAEKRSGAKFYDQFADAG